MNTFTILKKHSLLIILWMLLGLPISLRGEGTKEIRPTAGDFGYVVLDPAWSPFALYGCPATSRIHIRVCNVGEKVYYGFNQAQGDVKYQIKDPNGNIVVAQSNVPTTGAGFITSFNRAVNGPSAIVGGSGYSELSFTPTMTGDFYIEFKLPNGNPRREFEYFDITVATATNKAILGRVWSQSWMFSTGAYGRAFKGSAFIYADDGIVTSLDFNGMDPYVFVLNANKTGTGNTGNAAADRQSKPGVATYPQYKVFLNDPEEACFPTGTFGQITAPTTISGCPPTNFCINISVNKQGMAEVLLDLNGVSGFQAGTADRILSKEILPPGDCIPWDGKDGLGNRVTTSFPLNTTVNFYNGLTHIPLYDVERNPNGYKVNLVRPSGGPAPQLFYDDSQIAAAGGATNLNGCNSPCHTWDWTCCTNNAGTDYGNTNTINTWWYADSTRSISANLVPPGIIVDADTRNPANDINDSTICGNVATFKLAGKVTNATGGQWSTSGTGTFSPNNATLTGTYNITAADHAAGQVTLTLSSTGNGACPAVKDNLILKFQAPPTVNAGPDAITCSNNPGVKLNGTITNVPGAIWTSTGTGTFSPSNTDLKATYTPSPADITAKTITLTLTTTGNGTCLPINDQMIITIQDMPTANAGSNQSVCSNNPTITLSGTMTNGSTSTWSGGAGTYSPNANTLNATYTPTAAEVAAGAVNLTLSVTRNGCTVPVQSNVAISFNGNPTVNAGPDQSICLNNSNVTLTGTTTNASTYVWSGGAGTFTPNNTSLSAVYVPTTAEKTAGSVTLTLTASATGCNSVNDQMKITFTSSPTVNAGKDGTVCANNSTYTLSGSYTGAGGATWSGGTGTFSPSANSLTATYTPSASEVTTGIVALVLTTTGNNSCAAVKDTMLLSITPAPTAKAGNDVSVCANTASTTLTGSATAASSYVWTGGTGTFIPNNTTLNAKYIPSPAEIAAGSVTLTLTSNRNTCNPVSDQAAIAITPAPQIDAGPNQTICTNNPTVALAGTISVSSGVIWSGGKGKFSDVTDINAIYEPAASEKTLKNIQLTLTSTGNGTCAPVSDKVIINFNPEPTVNAGPDQTVCGNNATATLAGSFTVAKDAQWSGGTGTFSPSNTQMDAKYTPSAAEIAAGKVTLTLTAIDNANKCNPVVDDITINITPSPTVNAGTDITICESNPVATLNGSKTVATGILWSGGTGTFAPNNTTLNASYTPSAAELNAETATLTLTTTGNGTCNPVSDNVVISTVPGPTVSAGPDQVICSAKKTISLNGSMSNAGGVQWITAGTGTFRNPNTLTPTYQPSAADIQNGSVTVTIQTTGGNCAGTNDQMIITFTEVPTVNAGPDQIICSNDFPIQLGGSGSQAKWTGGTGTFTPDTNTFNASYIPSASEITAGSVTLTLTTIPNGACPTVSDKVKLTLVPAPIANAGIDQTMCGNNGGFTLNGKLTNAKNGFWSSTGTGTFTPNPNTLTAVYNPSALDKTNGTVTLTLSTTGSSNCKEHSDDMILTIQPEITLSAGPDQTVCGDNKGISLFGTATNANGITWSSSGSGSFTPNNTILNSTYFPSIADKAAGSVTITLSTPANGSCPAMSDNVIFTLTPAPKVVAGSNQTICGDISTISLNGTVTGATGAQWTTNGLGIFTPDASSAATNYTVTSSDLTNGSVKFIITTTGNGICKAVSDSLTVTITPAPSVNAGPDQVVCSDIGAVHLNGKITVATGGQWTTSGNGTFANTTSPVTTYTPSANDITAGTVTLTLTSTGNGTCKTVYDEIIITLEAAPIVNAGPDRNVCQNNPDVSLQGSILNAIGGMWSGGNGKFSPNNSSLNATYTPSASEIAAGTVTLTLTSTNNGICNSKSDQVVINITPTPTVNAGPDQTICADSIGVALNGSFTIASGAQWTSSGTGNFFPNNIDPKAFYVPTVADKNNGTVTITFTTTGNGNCLAVSDAMVMNITPAPTVKAGINQIVCANNSKVSLNGSVTVASGATWTSTGSGTFTNINNTITDYTPSPIDIMAGSVMLTLTSTGNGTCNPVSSQIKVTITPAPTVNAGPDQTVCANKSDVKLNGSFTGSTGINWTTNGSGTFTPDANTAVATYTPSPSDITTGTVTLSMTTQGNGLCNAVTDQMIITITPAPIVNAGSDQTICADASGITLNGTVTNANGGIWTSSGSGIFSPSAGVLNAVYTPSPADTAAHTVTFTLTSSGNGLCNAVTDQMILNITPAPIIDAGNDLTVCGDLEFVSVAGTVKNAGGAVWTTSGKGLFSPDATNLTPRYFFAPSELTGGTIVLTLTSTNNGTCKAVSDQRTITINPVPSANAGSDQTACANNGTITLNGSITNATGAIWTTTGEGNFSNANSLNTTYTPSATDIAGGTVVLTISTTISGSCNPATDQMILTLTPAPTVNAGSDQSICSNNTTISLNGTVTLATGATWSSSGSGTFSPGINTLNATYNPSASDVAAGNVTLTLTSTGNGNCIAVTDQMIVTFTPAPTVTTGNTITACANTTGIVLNGSVTVASGGTWSTASNTGVFLPNANSLNTTFIPSPLQISNGRANLTLTTTGNGNCAAVSEKLTIILQPVPVVSAGPDLKVCTGSTSVNLNGSITGATGATWSTSGTGTFNPNANTLNATYIPTASENTNGNKVTLTLTSTGNGTCSPVTDQVDVNFQTLPVNAGPDQTACSNGLPVQLNGSGNGTWSGGAGTFSDANSLNTTYTPAASEIPGTITLTLTGSATGACVPGTDQVIITVKQGPVVIAGNTQTVCANNAVVTLNGNVTNATGGSWTTEGSGTFGNKNAINTNYTPSAADIATGSVRLTLTSTGNGICKASEDTLLINFTPAPVTNAGSDMASCANSGPVNINGSVTIATSATWSIVSGTGTISNANGLSTSYNPSAADITAGSVTLRLTSGLVNNCNAVSDDVQINFGSAPTANAGADQTICADASNVTLNGTVTVATKGRWTTSGTGTFSPNADVLNASYSPSTADTSNKSVVLTLSTTDNGNCIAASDQMTIKFTPAPTVKAGPAQTVCADVANINLSGNVTVATGGVWKTSGTGTFTNDNSLNTTYNPSASDKKSGSVTLTLTTTGSGTCHNYSDITSILFTPAPTADAGNDQTVCKDIINIRLNGTITLATGIVWSTSGSGSFDDAKSLTANYTPSAADNTSGTVTLTMTTTGNGNCQAVSDKMNLSFTPAPTVNAGPDKNICADKDSIHISGTSTIAAGILWTSSGSGTFSPSASDANAIYYLSNSDRLGSIVTLTLTTTGNGTCNPVNDQVVVNVAPRPVVNSGPDQTICAGQSNATLNGTVINAGGGTWATNGTGTFSNANSLNATYVPSPADFAKGGAILTLTSTSNGTCSPVSDAVVINIIKSPAATVNAGLNQTVCADAKQIQLTGYVSNAGGGIWSHNGTGTLNPDNTSLEVLYIPTAADTTAGSVTLTLTTTQNGQCNASSDQVKISFTPAPKVNAGIDQVVCGESSLKVGLSGAVTIAKGGMWTGGSGVYAPDPVTLTTTYYPSASEKTSGKITLTLTTTGNGTCNAVSDDMLITITKPPVVNAGSDVTVCADALGISLIGKVTNATTGQWTTSGTGNFINPTAVTTVYRPSVSDTAIRVINLTLTSVGGCIPVSDDLKITFSPKPIVNAGPDQKICANTTLLSVTGKVANATNTNWTTTGSGYFTKADKLITTYMIPNADTKGTDIKVILSSVSNGICAVVSDTATIAIQQEPQVQVSTAHICEPELGSKLNATITNATSGVWTSTGTGVFAPNATLLTPTYYPSAKDLGTGSITLTFSSTDNGSCAAATQNTILKLNTMPIADAGKDQNVCPGSSTTLVGKSKTNVSFNWSTISGSQIDNNSSTSVTVSSDTSYVLTVTDINGCTATDTLNVRIFKMPSFNLKPEYCLSNDLILNSDPQPLPNVPGIYQWYFNNKSMTGKNAPVVTPDSYGDYKVMFSFGNCFTSQTTVVNNPPQLSGEFIKDCINNTTTVTIKSKQTGVNYVWSTGQTGLDLTSIDVPVKADTTYYTATVTDTHGCSSKDSSRVIGVSKPAMSIQDSSSCKGKTILLNGRPKNIPGIDSLYPSYTWFKNSSPIGDNKENLSVKDGGTYNVKIQIGRCVAMDSAKIVFNDLPVSMLPDKEKFCKERDNQITVDAGANRTYTYQWSAPAGIKLDSINNHSVVVRNKGYYSVVLTNSFKCTIKDSIWVNEVCPPRLFVPTAFTPTIHGNDNTFKVFGDHFTNYKMLVFNRWGEVIFESSNRNEAWDGTYRGELMPVGVYPWIVTYEGEDPDNRGSYHEEGSVTLIR